MKRKFSFRFRMGRKGRCFCHAVKARAAMARLKRGTAEANSPHSLSARLGSCLQTILELEPSLRKLSVGHVLLKEFGVLRTFLDKMEHIKVSESEVRRIESATERFLWELNGPVSFVELHNNKEHVIQ